jgi:hypothetical protein
MIEFDSFDGLVTPRLALRDAAVTDVAIFSRNLGREAPWGVVVVLMVFARVPDQWDVFVCITRNGVLEGR